jgi:hypothetical protein
MTRLLLNLLAVARHAIRPTIGKDPTGKPVDWAKLLDGLRDVP